MLLFIILPEKATIRKDLSCETNKSEKTGPEKEKNETIIPEKETI